MIKNSIITILLLGLIAPICAQVEKQEDFLTQNIPQEQVYIQINNSLLLTGERLLYKFYTLQAESKKLSELSKIGRVELISQNGDIIFEQKVKLYNGLGAADFFIDSDLKSGLYKLIGYTNWMLNAEDSFFQQDILIINPYQGLSQTEVENDQAKKSGFNEFSESNSIYLNLILDKSSYKQREEVKLLLKNLEKISGDFSISVRKVDEIEKPRKINSADYSEYYKIIKWNFKDTLFYPEIRGAYFQGKISGDDDLENLSEKKIVISSPGEENQLQIVSTANNGNFSFIVDESTNNDKFLFQVLDSTKAYEIDLVPLKRPNLDKLSFHPIKIDSVSKESILEKSINIQIENAYNSIKTNAAGNRIRNDYFFDSKLIKYNLDEYNRFNDVRQTFTEIVQFGRIRKNAAGKNVLLVRNINPYKEFNNPALLIVDGVVEKDHEKLLTYDPYKIESISVLRNKLFFGPSVFSGAIIIETKNGNYPEEFHKKEMVFKKLETPQKTKEYYRPDYSTKALKRIPDYRYQLFWEPDLKLTGKDQEISFYTSDLEGKFKIDIEGFTKEGKPVSISKAFEVE